MSEFPIKFFLVKIASRCNLNCGYCYVYNHADQSWRDQPKLMSFETARTLGQRIREHALAWNLNAVRISLHGGEPLLAGQQYIGDICDQISEHAGDIKIRFSLQTNGTLLDESWIRFFSERSISVGLSSDGPADVTARRRPLHSGKSAFAAIERGTSLLASEEGRRVWAGFLTVIDVEADPFEVYDYLRSFNPPSIDFLFPLIHHDHVTLKIGARKSPTAHADWLLKIFNRWYRERPYVTSIRKFKDIIALSMGSQSASEEWGLQPRDLIVVETNGDLEATDSLKITYPGACKLGMNISSNSFDEVLNSVELRQRQTMWSTLSNTCRQCEFVKTCGGGYYPHRYSSKNGFDNPSVYCEDIKKLISEIQAVVKDDLVSLSRSTAYQPEHSEVRNELCESNSAAS